MNRHEASALYEKIEYNADTMPQIDYEEETGFVFEKVKPGELDSFAVANRLEKGLSQAEYEGFLDGAVK
jgi:hypothetical protein